MTQQPVTADERTVAVGDASCRWACTFAVLGISVDIVVRALVQREAYWDLVALVLVTCAISALYMRAKRVQAISRRQMLAVMLVGLVIAGATAAMVALRPFGN